MQHIHTWQWHCQHDEDEQESCQQINFTPGHMAAMATGCHTTPAAATAVYPLPLQCQCVKQRAMRNNLQNVIISFDFAQQQTEKKQLEKHSRGVDGGEDGLKLSMGRPGTFLAVDKSETHSERQARCDHTSVQMRYPPISTRTPSMRLRLCSARLVYHHQGWSEAELTPYVSIVAFIVYL